jgi:hypothetical protein
MPDFLAQELVNQRLDQVNRNAHDGARRHALLREALAARRGRRAER